MPRRISSLITLPSLALLLAAGSSSSLSAQSSVSGKVLRSESGAPIVGAEVLVVGAASTTRTDSLGRYRVLGLEKGRYEIEARSIGRSIGRHSLIVDGEAVDGLDFVLAPAAPELAGVTVIGAATDALARVPGSARVIDERALRALQPRSANDALRTVSGVHVQEEEGAGLRANIGVRGLDPDRSRSVLVLEDGVPVALAPYGEPELYYSPPIDRMSRVEVLKGSGSILFGPQTVGGVVNYVTADPPALRRTELEVRGGGSGSRFARATVGGSRGRTGAILTAFDRSAQDLQGLRYGIRDATGKVVVRTSAGDFGAKLSLYDESSNATYVGLTDSLFRAAPRLHPAPDDRLAIARQAATLSHEIGAGTTALRTVAYAYHTTRDWERRDYTYGPTGGTLVFASGTGARNRSFDVAGVEPRFRSLWTAGGITSDLDLGARYHRERARDRYLTTTAPGAVPGVRDDERRSGEAFSVWVQNRFALAPGLDVTPGLRAEHFRFERRILRTRVRRSDGTTTTRTPEDVDIRSGDDVSELIPGIGATWSPRPLVTLFAGVHRGFAPPRTKDALIYADATLAPGAQVPDPVSLQLDAERSWNHELGVRAAVTSFATVELTTFRLDFTNQIIEPSLSAGSAAAAALANQGATRHAGVEIGGRVDMGRWGQRPYTLALEGNLTLVDSRFSADRFLRQGSDTVNVRGNQLPYAPRQRAHAALVLDHPGGLEARVDATFVGAQFTDNFETRAGSANGRIGRIPPLRLFDAAISHALPGLPGVRASAAVKNIEGRAAIASRRPEGIKVTSPRLVSLGLVWSF